MERTEMAVTFCIGPKKRDWLAAEWRGEKIDREPRSLVALWNVVEAAEKQFAADRTYAAGKKVAEARREFMFELLMQRANVLSALIVSEHMSSLDLMKDTWLVIVNDDLESLFWSEGDKRFMKGAEVVRDYAQNPKLEHEDWIAEFMAS